MKLFKIVAFLSLLIFSVSANASSSGVIKQHTRNPYVDYPSDLVAKTVSLINHANNNVIVVLDEINPVEFNSLVKARIRKINIAIMLTGESLARNISNINLLKIMGCDIFINNASGHSNFVIIDDFYVMANNTFLHNSVIASTYINQFIFLHKDSDTY